MITFFIVLTLSLSQNRIHYTQDDSIHSGVAGGGWPRAAKSGVDKKTLEGQNI